MVGTFWSGQWKKSDREGVAIEADGGGDGPITGAAARVKSSEPRKVSAWWGGSWPAEREAVTKCYRRRPRSRQGRRRSDCGVQGKEGEKKEGEGGGEAGRVVGDGAGQRCPRLHRPRRGVRRLQPVVRVGAGVDAAEPVLRPLRHLPRRVEQCPQGSDPRLPLKDDLCFDRGERDELQNIPTTLFFKSLRKLKNVVRFHSYKPMFRLHARLGKLPYYVVVEQRYFDVEDVPRERRPPFPRCGDGAEVCEVGVRGAAGEPAVERDGAAHHLR